MHGSFSWITTRPNKRKCEMSTISFHYNVTFCSSLSHTHTACWCWFTGEYMIITWWRHYTFVCQSRHCADKHFLPILAIITWLSTTMDHAYIYVISVLAVTATFHSPKYKYRHQSRKRRRRRWISNKWWTLEGYSALKHIHRVTRSVKKMNKKAVRSFLSKARRCTRLTISCSNW